VMVIDDRRHAVRAVRVASPTCAAPSMTIVTGESSHARKGPTVGSRTPTHG
jgi:hypothetical protein